VEEAKDKTIQLTIDEHIATLTFNRPKALNALNSQLLSELSDTLTQVEGNEDIRVLVLTGAGEKAFIAGADITEINKLTPLGARQFGDFGQNVINMLHELPIPVIAAVGGFALGGGFEMALACDFIIASPKATFGLPEINLGIIPGFGGTQRLARIVGANIARELIFTGRFIKGEEAQAMGIVSKIYAPEELMAGALETAKLIASKGRTSLMLAKSAVRQGLNTDLKTGLAIERDAFALCLTSPDAKEGTGAFLEKRSPNFTGRRDG